MGDPPPKLRKRECKTSGDLKISGTLPKRQKRDLPTLQLPLQPMSTTGANDCKINHSSIAGHVSGNLNTDNSKNYIKCENAIFIDRQAALSRLIDGTASFVKVDRSLAGQSDSFVELIVKPKLSPTELDPHQETDSIDSSDDCNEDTISDEHLYDMILSEQNSGENDDDINEISDDFVYLMAIRHRLRSNDRAGELNIQLRVKSMNVSPKDIGVEEKGYDFLEQEDIVTASADQCGLKYPVKTDDDQTDVKLKSVVRVGKPCYQMFVIDLSDIVDRKVRIVTTENVNKTVEIARYKPNDTWKVTSFLDQIFEETHCNYNKRSFSTPVTSTDMVNNIKTLKGVCGIDKRKIDDTSFVTIDLSDIITHYDGYVLLKTKHNVEIIVKIAEKDPDRTKEIAQFLTETYLV